MPLLTTQTSKGFGFGKFSPSNEAYEWIATATSTNNSNSTISIDNIPSTYQHLQLRWSAGIYNNADFLIKFQFNTDTSTTNTNYSRHGMWNNAGTGSVQSDGEGDTHHAGWIYSSNAGSDWFAPAVIDILDYTNTNKYKVIRFYGGNDNNSGADCAVGGGMWRSTSAINSITLRTRAGNHRTNSEFSLYGIKG
jgi:hypothetical protein